MDLSDYDIARFVAEMPGSVEPEYVMTDAGPMRIPRAEPSFDIRQSEHFLLRITTQYHRTRRRTEAEDVVRTMPSSFLISEIIQTEIVWLETRTFERIGIHGEVLGAFILHDMTEREGMACTTEIRRREHLEGIPDDPRLWRLIQMEEPRQLWRNRGQNYFFDTQFMAEFVQERESEDSRLSREHRETADGLRRQARHFFENARGIPWEEYINVRIRESSGTQARVEPSNLDRMIDRPWTRGRSAEDRAVAKIRKQLTEKGYPEEKILKYLKALRLAP